MQLPTIVAITGASGALYAIRLLECLARSDTDIHLTVSPSGALVLHQELGIAIDIDNFRPEDLCRSSLDGLPASDLERLVQSTQRSLAAALETRDGNPARIYYHRYTDYMAPIASGSFLAGGMVICPCSGSTLSAVVHGSSNNLIQRAADVQLKERRRLVMVPREMPLSSIQLENMRRACDAGAVIMPAMPGWYHGVQSLGDLVDFVVARILDQLGIENQLISRWGAEPC